MEKSVSGIKIVALVTVLVFTHTDHVLQVKVTCQTEIVVCKMTNVNLEYVPVDYLAIESV
jgi:hypothetical protein